jgi:neutral ceramidase
LGERLGTSIVSALQDLKDGDFRSEQHLSSRQIYTDLPLNSFESISTAQQKLNEATQRYQRLRKEGSPHGPLRTAECDVFGREESLTLAIAQANGELAKWQARYRSAEVQAFRLGNVFIVAWPGEQFVEYGLELKRRAGHRVFVISIANGELQGYIATTKAAEAGSYEAAFAMFKPQAGDCLVEAALDLIKKMA